MSNDTQSLNNTSNFNETAWNATHDDAGRLNFGEFNTLDFLEGDGGREIEEAANDARREVKDKAEREWEQFFEDVECWWAGLNGGNPDDCPKRQRRIAEDNCYSTPNMFWDWIDNVCFEYDEQRVCDFFRRDCERGGSHWNQE